VLANREAGIMANGDGVNLGSVQTGLGNNTFAPPIDGTGTAVTFLPAEFSGSVKSGTIRANGNTRKPFNANSKIQF
jgi:hypothetical protein